MPTLAFSEMKTGTGTASLVSSSITVNNGDVIVVKSQSENNNQPTPSTPTATGQSFASYNSYNASAHCHSTIFAATVTGNPGTLTVTAPFTGSTGSHSCVFERWTNAALDPTPAVNATKNVDQANGFNGSLTTEGNNSALSWCAADYSATAEGTPGYRSSATSEGITGTTGVDYKAYYAYQACGTAGAQSFGLTTPATSTIWTYLGIEILHSGTVLGEGTASGTVSWAGTAEGPPPIALRAAGAALASGTAVTAINPTVPAGATTGDLSVLCIAMKPYTTTVTESGTLATWTKIGEATNGTVANSAADVGSTKVAVFVKESAAVGAIGNIGFTGADTVEAQITTYSKDPAKVWDLTNFTTGGDTTNGANFSATGAAGLTLEPGDWVYCGVAVNTDLGTATALDIGGLAGVTLTENTRADADSTTGFDINLKVRDGQVTAGTTTAAPTFTYTNASSSSGTALWLRLRQTADTSTGTASGTVEWAGTTTGVRTPKGTAAGTVSWAGTAAGARTPKGSASGTVSWAGTATGATPTGGSASGTVSWAGTATAARTSLGTAAGTASWAGTAAGARTSRGTAAGTVTWDGTASGISPTGGTASGTVEWAGTASGARASAGTAAGTVTWAGTATGEMPGGTTLISFPQDDPDWTTVPTNFFTDPDDSINIGQYFALTEATPIVGVRWWANVTMTARAQLWNVDTGVLLAEGADTACSVGWNDLLLSAPYDAPALTNLIGSAYQSGTSITYPFETGVWPGPVGGYSAGPLYVGQFGGLTRFRYNSPLIPNILTDSWMGVHILAGSLASNGEGSATGTVGWAGTAVGDNGGASTGAVVLAEYSALSSSTHVIPLTGATAGRDLIVFAAAPALITGPGTPWEEPGGAADTFYGGGAKQFRTFRLRAADNTSTLTSITLTLNAPRKLDAVVIEDDIDWDTLYIDLNSGNIPVSGNTLWGTAAHTVPTRDAGLAVFAGGTSDATTAGPISTRDITGFDQGYTILADSGGNDTNSGTSPHEAMRIWVAIESPAGAFTGDGVTATFSPAALFGQGTTGLVFYDRTAGPAPGLGEGYSNGTVSWAGTAVGWDIKTIAEENALPGNGSGEWAISGAGDTTVQGFARPFSANVGETMNFACHGAGTVLDIYRIGYYSGGEGWRKVASLTNTATTQPDPVTIPDSNGAIECTNWSNTATWTLPVDLTSGLYCGVYRNAAGNNASYIPFVVRDDNRQADIIVKTSDATWALAYNYFGTPASPLTGKSWYGGGPGAFGSMESRAFASTYEKPIVTRGGVSQTYWLACEAPMIRWLERMGYNLKYVSCRDIENDPSCLDGAQILLSSGHDEYWSQGMRDAFEAQRDAGTHLVFASANEVFWRIRYDAGGTRAWCYKDSMPGPSGHVAGTALDPVSWTGTWKDTRPANAATRAPENTLTGTDFRMNGVIDLNAVLTAADDFADHPVWRNTSIYPGGSGTTITATGVIGFEADSMLPTRPNATILASEFLNIDGRYADDNGENYNGNGNLNWGIVAQKYPSGAAVVGFGTCQWSWALDTTHDRAGGGVNLGIQQFTYNLLRDLGAAPVTPHTGIVTSSPAALIEYGGPVGTASGTVTWAGTATGETPAGSAGGPAAGTVSWDGTAQGARDSDGTAAGTVSWAGTATGRKTTAGTAAGTVSWAGTATGRKVTAGTASGTVSFSGAAVGTRPRIGSAAGTVTWAGAATGAVQHRATAAGTVTWAGLAIGTHLQGGGSAAGTVSWAGTADGKRIAKGTVSGTVTWAGTAVGDAPVVDAATGTAAGTVAWAGSAGGARISLGSGVGTVTWTGTSIGLRGYEGAAAGTVTWTGTAVGRQGPIVIYVPGIIRVGAPRARTRGGGPQGSRITVGPPRARSKP